ncbi:hypothetical protein, partial [Chloroflexus sp.]|uniref:hypothetical protein n=1 Tax=Chloroflexus sp. TaxID=1904827 RepID=UPI00404A1429
MIEDTKLSSSVTIAQYRELEARKDRKEIAKFVQDRFSERYIKPLHGSSKDSKHGFCTMAICCLMIEALESFWHGWSDTKGKSRKAFHHFFVRCSKQNLALEVFSPIAEDFYKGVRCGILHQAETTNGWRIRRKGLLFDPATKTINATRFHVQLGQALQIYCDTLEKSALSLHFLDYAARQAHSCP